jgi:hypothetical protein
MYLMLLGGLLIWFVQTIILTLVLAKNDIILTKNRLVIFFGTGIISPVIYILFGWLTMLILKISNMLDNQDLLDTWLLIPYGLLMFALFFGTPLLTMKLIIKILKREKKSGI